MAWLVVLLLAGGPDAGVPVTTTAAEDQEIQEKLELLQNLPAIEELELMRELADRPDAGTP